MRKLSGELTGSLFPQEEPSVCGFGRGGMCVKETDSEINKSSYSIEDLPPSLCSDGWGYTAKEDLRATRLQYCASRGQLCRRSDGPPSKRCCRELADVSDSRTIRGGWTKGVLTPSSSHVREAVSKQRMPTSS
ncbi:hypothetical protein PAMP_020005 [Pampus punctatissimus]